MSTTYDREMMRPVRWLTIPIFKIYAHLFRVKAQAEIGNGVYNLEIILVYGKEAYSKKTDRKPHYSENPVY